MVYYLIFIFFPAGGPQFYFNLVDIEIPGGMAMKKIEQFILKYIEKLPDAILRIRDISNPNSRFKAELNSRWLRKILPETVNFVFKRDT